MTLSPEVNAPFARLSSGPNIILFKLLLYSFFLKIVYLVLAVPVFHCWWGLL